MCHSSDSTGELAQNGCGLCFLSCCLGNYLKNTPLKSELSLMNAKIRMRVQWHCLVFLTSEVWTQSGHLHFLFGLLTQHSVLVFIIDMKNGLFVGIGLCTDAGQNTTTPFKERSSFGKVFIFFLFRTINLTERNSTSGKRLKASL